MCLCPACHRLCLVSAEVIQNQMDATLRPVGQHHFLEKGAAVDTLLAGGSTPERLSCLRTERCEELQGPRLSSVSVGPTRRAPSPPWSPSRHGLEWPQLVETNDRTIGGRVPIQTNYGVFFTSKSGSVLWHQVWPVRNRKPCRWRMRRIVSRLNVGRAFSTCRYSSNLARDQLVNPSPSSRGHEVAASITTVSACGSYSRGRPLRRRPNTVGIPSSWKRLIQRCALV